VSGIPKSLINISSLRPAVYYAVATADEADASACCVSSVAFA